MKENPEFYKAFPQLQGPVYAAGNPDHKGQEYIPEDFNTTELI